MRYKGPRQIALAASVLLAATAPAARAGTITLAELHAAQGSAHFRPASEVRLRVAPQGGGVVVAQGVQGQQSGSGGTSPAQQSGGAVGARVAAGAGPDGSLSGSGGQIIETVDFGDVTGTVCDCGEIPVAALPKVAGAFPWWAVAGIPLVCVSGICFDSDDETPPNTPNPTPTPPTQPTPPPPPPPAPIPEPATLLLFGTGLLAAGANARRRRSRRQAAADNTREGV